MQIPMPDTYARHLPTGAGPVRVHGTGRVEVVCVQAIRVKFHCQA